MTPCLDGQVQSKAYVNTTGSVSGHPNKASISIKQVAILLLKELAFNL